MKIVTPAQMREIDRRAIVDVGIPSLVLMDRAGYAASRVAARLAPGPRALVVAGSGNNGGDGLVTARYLADVGFSVRVCALAGPEKLSHDARVNYECYVKTGGAVNLYEKGWLARAVSGADVVVDALLGTGSRGAPQGAYAEAIRIINRGQAPVLALDVPSGIDGDTGAVPAAAVDADATVTFGLPKLGLLLFPARDYAGELYVADIGFPAVVIDDLVYEPTGAGRGYVARVPRMAEITARLEPLPLDAHKGTAGKAYLLAGSRGMTGAAILAGKASLRAGAGLTTVGLPASQDAVFKGTAVECISQPLAETLDGAIAASAWRSVREGIAAADACAVGPGVGRSEETRALITRALKGVKKPVVVDADGLNLLGLEGLRELKLRGVLTPHAGEIARLLRADVAAVQADRIGAARALAEATAMTVILKGYLSVIIGAAREAVLNPTGNPGLASGGTGDVLTGVLLAFLSRGMDPFDAAVTAAYVHGYAGDLAARDCGERSLVAGDLLASLPGALRELAVGPEDGADVGYDNLWVSC